MSDMSGSLVVLNLSNEDDAPGQDDRTTVLSTKAVGKV